MSQIVKSNGSPTTKTIRRAFGIQGHRPSRFNACIGAQMKDKSYAKPPAGMGGRHNKAVHDDFTDAVNHCKGK
jgi:hypothetical protein